jgi:hypothetical protein
MSTLAQTTCRIHFNRPASARCPICRQFYCPECITEHDGRFTCAACLKTARETVAKPEKKRQGLSWFQPVPILHCLIGLVIVWVIFHIIAQTLTSIPDQFHDGTIWIE